MFALLWHLESANSLRMSRPETLSQRMRRGLSYLSQMSATRTNTDRLSQRFSVRTRNDWFLQLWRSFLIKNKLKAEGVDRDMEQEFEDIDSEGRWQNLYLVSEAKSASMLMSHAIYSKPWDKCLFISFICLFLNVNSVCFHCSSFYCCWNGDKMKVKL